MRAPHCTYPPPTTHRYSLSLLRSCALSFRPPPLLCAGNLHDGLPCSPLLPLTDHRHEQQRSCAQCCRVSTLFPGPAQHPSSADPHADVPSATRGTRGALLCSVADGVDPPNTTAAATLTHTHTGASSPAHPQPHPQCAAPIHVPARDAPWACIVLGCTPAGW